MPYTYLCPISPISMGSHLLMSSIALKYLWFHHNMIPWPSSTYRFPVSSDIRVCVSVCVESVLCLWSTSCGNVKHVGSSLSCSIVPYGHVHTSISTYPISAVGIWAYVHLSMHTHMMQFFLYLSNILFWMIPVLVVPLWEAPHCVLYSMLKWFYSVLYTLSCVWNVVWSQLTLV